MSCCVDYSFFKILAQIARKKSLCFFRQAVFVSNKERQGFDPLTAADVEVERALRNCIGENFPKDSIHGEEEEKKESDGEFCWVIDPIDGTRSFISGLPVWGILVGRLCKGQAVAGMMAQPFTQELFFATKEGSFLDHYGQVIQRLQVRTTENLADAILFSTDPYLFKDKKAMSFSRLVETVKLVRFGTDCYAFSMLAAGFIDLVVEINLKPHDIIALIPIIRNAGGIITQWNGDSAELGGDIIAATTLPLYHAAVEELSYQY